MSRKTTIAMAAVGALAVGAYATAQIGGQNTGTPPITGPIDAGTFRQVAQVQMPTVVSIRTVGEAQTPAVDFGGLERFREFFGGPGLGAPPDRVLEGAGSGFIIDPSGLVLTNHHVVESARDIEVTLFADPLGDPDAIRKFSAKVLGRDPLTDSALLQLSGASDLPVAKLGDSDVMRPGDWVMAIGNPFALSHTVTVGVVSATSRPFPVEGRLQRVLQTDAAVNPGNSGGPLLNLRGEVVGVNTAILSATGANVGVGFAVPINLVRNLVTDLKKGDIRRGRIGVEIRGIPAAARAELGVTGTGGVLVATVEPGGPAEKAGLRPGDVIVTFNGETLDNPDELVRLVSNAAPDSVATLGIVRDKAPADVKVTIGELSGSRVAAAGPATETGLGLTLRGIDPETARQRGFPTSGVLIERVERASAAAEAGLQPGDVILEVNRTPVTGLDDAVGRLRGAQAGSPIFMLVSRNGQRVFVVVTKPK
jgi:serine protease Do